MMGKLKSLLIDSEYEDEPLDKIPDEVYQQAILDEAERISNQHVYTCISCGKRNTWHKYVCYECETEGERHV